MPTALREFAQRDAGLHTPTDVVDRPAVTVEMVQLMHEQIIEIIDVEHVADLQARAAEPHIGQRPAVEVSRHPQHHEALIDLTHLPWAGEHTAAIDHGAVHTWI